MPESGCVHAASRCEEAGDWIVQLSTSWERKAGIGPSYAPCDRKRLIKNQVSLRHSCSSNSQLSNNLPNSYAHERHFKRLEAMALFSNIQPQTLSPLS